MLNLWPLNGAAYAGSESRFRVRFAEAVVVASAVATASGLGIRPVEAEGAVTAEVEPTVLTYRDAGGSGTVVGTFYLERPRDLGASTFDGQTVMSGASYAIREGVATGDTVSFMGVDSTQLIAPAIADAVSSVYADATRIAAGKAEVGTTATRVAYSAWRFNGGPFAGAHELGWPRFHETEFLATPRHLRASKAVADCLAGASFDGLANRRGTGDATVAATAYTYAVVNGVHEAGTTLPVESVASVDPTRAGGGFADSDSWALFSVDPRPNLGSEAEGVVASSMSAVWWRYTHPGVEPLEVSSEAEADGHGVREGLVEIDVLATGYAQWSLIVRGRETIADGVAEVVADPTRIRPGEALASAPSDMVAEPTPIRYVEAEPFVTATAEVDPTRVARTDAPMEVTASAFAEGLADRRGHVVADVAATGGGATWSVETHETATIEAWAEAEFEGTYTHMAESVTEGPAADLEAHPWRTMHIRADLPAGYTAGGNASAWTFNRAAFAGSAYILRVRYPAAADIVMRPFINFTNAAPSWRLMAIQPDRRDMEAPSDNRLMVVR